MPAKSAIFRPHPRPITTLNQVRKFADYPQISMSNMSAFLRLFLSIAFLSLAATRLFAQLPPNQPEQDCFGAIPVCQDFFQQGNSYIGEGLNGNEINPAFSCLNTGERNSAWYIITVQTTGQLCFSVTPVVGTDDYDWAVYNLTNASCSDIATNPALEVSCDYAPNVGCGGVTGPNGNTTGPCSAQNEPCIPVQAGETYVVNVSNFTSSNNGYSLDLSPSTATITDNVPPEIDVYAEDCQQNIVVTFTENVKCSTVQPGDFVITNLAGTTTHNVLSQIGQNCVNGTFEDEFTLTLSPPITTSGQYVLNFNGQVEDNCDNVGIPLVDTFTIVVPSISILATNDTLCAGSSTTLSTPVQPGLTYSWTPGNATGNSLTVTPAATTTYSLTATDGATGCSSGGAFTVEVIPEPTADFTTTPGTICTDGSSVLTYTGSSLTGANFSWDFDGGTVVNGSGSGPYTVNWPNPTLANPSLTVDQFGCVSQPFSAPVSVLSVPSATFSAPTDVCAGSQATFSYTGTASPGATYTWDFDGGMVLSGNGPGPYVVDWIVPGPKNVCLVVEENGCISGLVCETILVNALPVMGIEDQTAQCLSNNAFTFAYTGSAAVNSYTWDFGDGNTSNQVSPTHSYATPGNRQVALLIVDDNGCENNATVPVEVFPQAELDFAYQAVCEGNPTPFNNLSTIGTGGQIVGYEWRFGDGNSSTDENPAYVYLNEGTYPLQLISVTAEGCRDTLAESIEVFEQPTADFAFESVCEDEAVVFQDNSFTNRPSLNYAWNFGVPGQVSAQQEPVNLFPSFGTYAVSLVVQTDQGCTDTVSREVEIFPLPQADFTVADLCDQEVATFTNLATVPLPGVIEQTRWRFGDGNQSDQATPAYTYGQPGIFPVQMIVVTKEGCRDSATTALTVHPRPEARFSVQPVCESDSALFVNNSTLQDFPTGDSISQWTWSFGDGREAGSLPEVAYRYARAGTYPVSLTVVSSAGCVSDRERMLEIFPNPAPPETMSDTVCFGQPALLMAASTAQRVEWFADLVTDRDFHRGFSYTTPSLAFDQRYYVEAVSENQCRSERVSVAAGVFPASQGEILASDTLLEVPTAVVELGVVGNIEAASYAWDFDDGQRSEAPTPVHQFEWPGVYHVTVEVVSVNGCVLNLYQVIEVKEIIEAFIPTAFTPNGDGENDFYYLETRLVEDFTFRVFNRWGQEVYQTQEPRFRWNGNHLNGQALPEGVYLYHLEGKDHRGRVFRRSGSITLIR